jgi:hypothetical protein
MTITPVSTNKTGTVGLCTGSIPVSKLVGKFSAKFLKEWAEQIADTFTKDTGEDQIYLYILDSDNKTTTAKCLAASEEPDDDLFVCVVGCEEEEAIRR